VISDAYSTLELLQSLLEALLWNVVTRRKSTLIPNRVGQLLKQLEGPVPVTTQTPGGGDSVLRHLTTSTVSERKTRIHRRLLDSKLSASIITVCKARGITLNECFAAALAGRYFHDALASGLGCNIHVLGSSLHVKPSPLDSQALSYRNALKKTSLGWAPSLLRHNSIKFNVAELCAAKHFVGPCITNSGISEFTSAIYRQVDFIETAVNRNVANYSVVLHLSSFRGRLQLLYTYASPAMSEALFKVIDYELMTRLGLLEASLPGHPPLMKVAI